MISNDKIIKHKVVYLFKIHKLDIKFVFIGLYFKDYEFYYATLIFRESRDFQPPLKSIFLDG